MTEGRPIGVGTRAAHRPFDRPPRRTQVASRSIKNKHHHRTKRSDTLPAQYMRPVSPSFQEPVWLPGALVDRTIFSTDRDRSDRSSHRPVRRLAPCDQRGATTDGPTRQDETPPHCRTRRVVVAALAGLARLHGFVDRLLLVSRGRRRPPRTSCPRAGNYTNYTRQAQAGGVCERENYTRNYARNYADNYTSVARGLGVLFGLWPRPP